jgi:hypothetical protein
MATQTQQSQSRNEQRSDGGMQRSQQRGRGDQVENAMQPFDDMYKYFQEYARERPDVVALWCFGIGFVLGWKLKPW